MQWRPANLRTRKRQSAPEPDSADRLPIATNEVRALQWLAVIALVAIAWLAHPFAAGVLLGALMAFTLDPLNAWLERRTRHPVFAALTTTVLSGVIVVAIAVGFGLLFVSRLVAAANAVRDGLRPDGALTGWLETATNWLGSHGVEIANVTSRLESGAVSVASWSAATAGSLAIGTFDAFLGLFFALLTMYAVLRYWPRMVSATVVMSLLNPRHTEAMLAEFRRAGRATLAGTVGTGLAQG